LVNAIKKNEPSEHNGGVQLALSTSAGPPPDPQAVAQAFRHLFESQAVTVWRALRHFGVGDREVEDAAQEVFVVVHRQLSEGTKPEHLRAWLYGIAWRVAAAWRRRAAHRHEVLTDAVEPEPDSSRDPARLLENQRRLLNLELALSTLPDEQRAVFVLYEIEELTMREVSEALVCSINTAFSRLYAARRKVSEELGIQVPEQVWKR
jgi:RNA polymerase sigma-70 factor (ECF subfamily)